MSRLRPVRLSSSRLLAVVVLTGALVGLSAPMADAHAEHGEHPPVVDVVEVSGFLDPVLVGMMVDTLEALDPAETVAVVFQVDSTASVVADTELLRLARLVVGSPVTVSFWVGPSGARATGPIAQLVVLGDDVGIAPGARFGAFGDPVLPVG